MTVLMDYNLHGMLTSTLMASMEELAGLLGGFLGIVIFVLALILGVMTLLLPFFVWKINKSIQRIEQLTEHMAKQSCLLTPINAEISNKISPTVEALESNIRIDLERKLNS